MKKILILSNKGGTSKSTVCVSLARVFNDSVILDLDPQETCNELARHSEYQYKVITSDKYLGKEKVLIIDTGGFFGSDSVLDKYIENSDLIIIPVKPNEPDLLAIRKGVIQSLVKHEDKIFVMFNQVKGISEKTNLEMIETFKQVLPDTKRLSTRFNDLKAFAKVFMNPLEGKALKQAEDLKNELSNLMYK